MKKFKTVVSACLTLSMLASIVQVSPIHNTIIKAAEITEKQQNDNILNKSTRLTEKDAELLLNDIQMNLVEKYQAEFKLDNFKAIFVDVANSQSYIDVDVIADMTLINNPMDTPYIKGMEEALENIQNLDEKAIAQQAYDDYVTEQMSYYNMAEETTFCYRIEIPEASNLRDNVVNYEFFYRTDISEDDVELELVPEDIQRVMSPLEKNDGIKAIEEEIQESTKRDLIKAVTYDASKAVTYAKDHAKDEPEFSKANGMGSDCANFLSKCLNAGGIPVDKTGKWNPSPKSGSYAGVNWMRTGYNTDSDGKKTGVKTYMTDKGYFKAIKSSTSAAKGGFMFWNQQSHVALVYSVTSSTIKYSQHSNVQQKQVTKVYGSEDVTFYNPDI